MRIRGNRHFKHWAKGHIRREHIRSEKVFLWSLIRDIALLPLTLLLIILGKRPAKELFSPLKDLLKFIFEPKTTVTLMLLNIGVYVWSLTFSKTLLQSLMSYPMDLFQLKLHTLITSGFLHASATHLVGNLIVLFIFGRVIERQLGSLKTALIYFGALIISGVLTSLIHVLILNDNIPGLGASGAIMGLVSAAILLDPFYMTYEFFIPLPILFVGWLALFADITGILNPVEDGIGHVAHLGGFISISLLMFLLRRDEREKLKQGLLTNVGLLLVLILLFVFRESLPFYKKIKSLIPTHLLPN